MGKGDKRTRKGKIYRGQLRQDAAGQTQEERQEEVTVTK